MKDPIRQWLQLNCIIQFTWEDYDYCWENDELVVWGVSHPTRTVRWPRSQVPIHFQELLK